MPRNAGDKGDSVNKQKRRYIYSFITEDKLSKRSKFTHKVRKQSSYIKQCTVSMRLCKVTYIRSSTLPTLSLFWEE